MTGRVLRGCVAAAIVTSVLSGVPAADAATVSPSAVRVSFATVARGLDNPVAVTSARDGTSRLFVVEQGGTVRIVNHGTLRSTPYLRLGSRVVSGGEQGLLSIAFHPDFTHHRFVYAAYTRASDGALQVSRFKAASATATTVDPATEVRILSVPHPNQTNHNAGQLAFGRGGLLYISTGDGGGAGDPYGNAEDLTSLLGKLLRIDVDHWCGKRHYCIPSGNPFAGSSTRRQAIFDWGLRNPWRFSVDRGDGTLWIGDVGQGAVEEIDHVRTRGGKDFGWSCREGNDSYNASRCSIDGRARSMTRPVHVYRHDSVNGVTRCAVIGGFAYHGPQYDFAHGLYVFGDYCTGEVWATGRSSSGGYPTARVGNVGANLTGFGEADHGELYAVDQSGRLRHLVFRRA